ncbi:MAG: hypothetical protein IIY45_08500 [Firmicutes bacterium]|nr:hypothetical protein [Bacillota bacterium]
MHPRIGGKINLTFGAESKCGKRVILRGAGGRNESEWLGLATCGVGGMAGIGGMWDGVPAIK